MTVVVFGTIHDSTGPPRFEFLFGGGQTTDLPRTVSGVKSHATWGFAHGLRNSRDF